MTDYAEHLCIARRMLQSADELLQDKKWNEAEAAIWVAAKNLEQARTWVNAKMAKEGLLEGER